MNDFIETINGKSYSIEEAKKIFITYTLTHGGTINDRIRSVKVEIYPDRLPNGSKAHANASLKENKIRIIKGKMSIITFFHELKHLVDGWKDANGNWHTNWDYENDLTAQMEWSNQQNREVNIKRGKKGIAMGEATAELFASKIFWELCGNSPESKAYTAKTRTVYDEEIVFLKKICLVLGIKEEDLLVWKSENNYGRVQLKNLFAKITGSNDFWDNLEYKMDYVSMLKFIKTSHPDFKVSQSSRNNVERYRKEINELLKSCMQRSYQERYYMSLGASKSEFEQIYSKKRKDFKLVDSYLSGDNPDNPR